MHADGQSAVTPSISQILEEYNSLAPEGGRLAYWKGRKVDLLEKLRALQEEAPEPEPEPEPELEPEQPLMAGRTIKDAAVELLLHVSHHDPNSGRPVGLPYDEVLRRIKQEFPDAATTVKCLRWYSVHINRDPNVRMPYRPRRRVARPSPVH